MNSQHISDESYSANECRDNRKIRAHSKASRQAELKRFVLILTLSTFFFLNILISVFIFIPKCFTVFFSSTLVVDYLLFYTPLLYPFLFFIHACILLFLIETITIEP